MTDRKKEEIKKQDEDDVEMCTLKETIMLQWPSEQRYCPVYIHAYWNYRDGMTVQNGLILKGTRIVIPKKMKMNIFEILHTCHLCQEKCKRRARSSVLARY